MTNSQPMSRSQAEYAEFAINNVDIGGHRVTVTRFFPQQDTQYNSNPEVQKLGQFIGQDHWVFDPLRFQPFGQLPTAASFQQALGYLLNYGARNVWDDDFDNDKID